MALAMPNPAAKELLAIGIFFGTYAAIALGKLPGTRVDRAGAALIGAGLMIGCGILPLQEAYRAIDLDTITLLLGMMIVVANLRVSGFFRLVTAWAAARARHPALLLVALVLTTGILSAFLVNDAICLVMTPIVITVTRALDRNPVPYLIAVSLASNVGSVATITGNPQNMIIGNLSGISYIAFSQALLPVAGIGLVITAGLVIALNPREYLARTSVPVVALPAHHHGWLAAKSSLVTLAMIILFFLGQPVAKVAICAAALLLVTRRIRPAKIYDAIDGRLLLMFAGLFVVVRGLEHAVLTGEVIERAAALNLGNTRVLAGLTAVLSNLVSNVPAVLVLKPFIEPLAEPQRAWLVVAMASTLAGNFTLLGSVANLIVAEGAAREGITIDFWTFFRVGAPLTLLTLAVGVSLLS